VGGSRGKIGTGANAAREHPFRFAVWMILVETPPPRKKRKTPPPPNHSSEEAPVCNPEEKLTLHWNSRKEGWVHRGGWPEILATN